jgi:hypothetical protein
MGRKAAPGRERPLAKAPLQRIASFGTSLIQRPYASTSRFSQAVATTL